MTGKLRDQVRLYHIRTSVRGHEHDQFKDEPGWQDAMRRNASRALADAILKEAGKMEVIDPKSTPLTDIEIDIARSQDRVHYNWTCEVVMPGPAFDHFGLQLDAVKAAAYNDGVEEIIEALKGTRIIWEDVAPQAAFMLKEKISDLSRELERRRRSQPVNPGALDGI